MTRSCSNAPRASAAIEGVAEVSKGGAMRRLVGVILVVGFFVFCCCDGDDEGCITDTDCPDYQLCGEFDVCQDSAPACEAMCRQYASCGVAPWADDGPGCAKDWCRSIEYYGETYGASCEAAQLAHDRCISQLGCDELATYHAETTPDGAPFCEDTRLAAKAACSTGSGTGGGPTSGDDCTSDSSCGSRERCTNGRCQKVECTNDAHCGTCERCSSDRCVDCGEGPFGCYC